MNEPANWIKFLGTAGARFVVMKQLRSSGGLWLHLGGTQLLVDPGPGTLVRCATSRPRLDPTTLSGIILTHRHLDHSNDVNIMIEAMTNGGFKHRGSLFAPAEALEEDPVVLRYLRSSLERIEILRQGGDYRLGNISFRTPIRHRHSAETYGLLLSGEDLPRIGLLVDTRYFDELVEAYRADVLVINCVRYDKDKATPNEILHLNVDGAERLISNIRPKIAVLTHFGMTMVRAKPWIVAEEISHRTGVKVVAASDGMKLGLDDIA